MGEIKLGYPGTCAIGAQVHETCAVFPNLAYICDAHHRQSRSGENDESREGGGVVCVAWSFLFIQLSCDSGG